MIRTHPETGRKAIYVNEGYTTRILELGWDESEALLSFLCRHCARADFVYRHRWNANDFVMWDIFFCNCSATLILKKQRDYEYFH